MANKDHADKANVKAWAAKDTAIDSKNRLDWELAMAHEKKAKATAEFDEAQKAFQKCRANKVTCVVHHLLASQHAAGTLGE